MPEDTRPERKRWRWLRREAIDLGDMAVQVISVVIGILLALAINDWATHRQHQATADEAMHAVHAELAQNRSTLHSNVTVLYAGARKLLALPETRNQPDRPCGAWSRSMFTVGVPDLTDAAYQIALSTRALSYMSFKHAEMIAQVYGGQSTFKRLAFPSFIHVLAGLHSPKECAGALLSFAKLEEMFGNNYAALIGPDRTPWPKPPAPSTKPDTSK